MRVCEDVLMMSLGVGNKPKRGLGHGQVISAYRHAGIRAFFAPMLNDDKIMYHNYIPVAADAVERNAREAGAGRIEGLGPGGALREESDPSGLDVPAK